MSIRTPQSRIISFILPLSVVALVTLAIAQPQPTTKPKELSTAQKQFNKLKMLIGDWVILDENDQPTKEIASRYSLTAGESAILEIAFPGTEHEMVTLYHLDGDDLILKHYCVMNNQPEMKVEKSDNLNNFTFKCTGHGTNMKSENDTHMHQGEIIFTDRNHVNSTWQLSSKGKIINTFNLTLVRKQIKNILKDKTE